MSGHTGSKLEHKSRSSSENGDQVNGNSLDGSVIDHIRVTLPGNGEKLSKVHKIVDQFNLSKQQMHSIMDVMESEMKLGLSRNEEDRKKSSLQMENTFVHETINGTEHGDYLALDLGGTNFRVIYMEMRNGKRTKEVLHHYQIPDHILVGPGRDLFDYLAECISIMLDDERITTTADPIPLGFTFSFPMIQSSLNSALLLTWTKKFKCSDTVMQDVVAMLEEAICRRKNLKVSVVAILNDTVGTLMTGAYEDHECGVGLILGTGSNASYVEQLDRVDKFTGNSKVWTQEIIDIEWGAFGDNGVLDFFKTKYDFEIDRLSNHRGSFTFEKLFSGLFLGELARLVMVELISKGLLFQGQQSATGSCLGQTGSFPTSYVSTIEGDDGDDSARSVIRELGADNPSDDDVTIVRHICALVSNRAAKIVVSALTVLLRHINKKRVTVAVDGSLFSCHPTLRRQMEQLIAYTAPETATKFIEVKDGSGRGAAYIAAVAERMNKSKTNGQQ